MAVPETQGTDNPVWGVGITYGRRLWPRPSFRDYDFWARFRPYAPPHGTNSHRERERARREDRDRGERRNRMEEEDRDLVPEEAPLAKNVLTVKSVNLHIPQNTKEHRTADYDCTDRLENARLVVRRGQVFIMTLTFQRPWSSQDDDLFLQFSVGDEPNEGDGTLEKFQLSETDSTRYKQEGRWGAKIAKQDGSRLSIYIYIAPDAIIGEWECQVSAALATGDNKEVFSYTGVPDIYVLFNPWCPEDQVHYTENPQDLNEYVLNEYGCVFNGLVDYIGRKPWFYGQFQDGILDVCMTLLRMAFDLEISKDMGDPVTVSRKLSRITVTIDSYKNENGEDLPEYKSDSIWNFHCWNDVWINRPDLDSTSSSRGRYSGWHALDSTPQERSEGRFQCGPSPHRAVKMGELSIGHDTGFIFAEVNGEVCTWMIPSPAASRNDLKLLSRDPHSVGKQISTKIPDGQPARGIFNPGAREGVTVDLVKPEPVMIGSDFVFTAIFSNTSNEGQRLSNVTLGVFPIDYRGERLGWDKVAYSKTEEISLKPGERRRFDLPVQHRVYQKLCDKSMAMMLRAAARVDGQDKPVTKMEKFVLSVPDIKLEVPSGVDKIRRGHSFTLVLAISNPLDRPLTSCRLQLTGPAFPLTSQGFSGGDGSFVKKIKDIFPSETTVLNIDMQAQERPVLNNTRQIEICVISKEMPDMEGTLTFQLQQ
ncbi:protein-glutamine gamma-glutamyltransferase K [Elysia marginata]|uniref:Protein-glutamine gamma-glutamyltransferase K n=1 Tax=Elysia marginata TaxID=1093978 RepID=A0AAV4HYJ4_9GAST|nr:protein-glutamine gamma-glutamyltransferase K [Elysia marginata]